MRLFGMDGNKAQKYRERAKVCHEAAAKAHDPLAKATWLGAEKAWLQLAEPSPYIPSHQKTEERR
jgi:hypothetical protein